MSCRVCIVSRKITYIACFALLLGLVGSASADVVFIKKVTSASDSAQGAIHTVNGSGMTGDLHDSSYSTLWMTAVGADGGGDSNPHPGTYNPGPGAHWTWIKFEFDQVYSLDELWVWNYNEWTVRGLKNVVIEYTSDGTTWETLGTSHLFARAPADGTGHGYDDYAHNTTIDFGGVDANAVIITTEKGVGVGNWGDTVSLFGLSEVRFYYTSSDPNASNPNPDNGVSNVVSTKVLSWSPGSGAVSHNVYLGTNEIAVTGATNPDIEPGKGNQTETTYDPCGLELGQEYFWRIDEVDGDSNVWPGEVWSFTVNVKDPELVLKHLNRGIVLDRQYHDAPPPNPIMTILPIDIQIIKSMGFDHIKLIVNPKVHKSGDGLCDPNMWYLDEIVNVVLDEELPVVVCIHPMPVFKNTHLGDWDKFQELLGFYEAFAAYMAARWDPNELAFQLMTEPFGNGWDWNIMQPLMWEAARNGMPDHTLILSGAEVGHINGLIKVEPVDDKNVYYTFTTYDPFVFTMQGASWWGGWWSYLGGVPYPSSPSIVAAAMPGILANIPDLWDTDVFDAVTAYGEEYWNKSRHQARMQQLVDWNNSHGGDLNIWCSEFGALDHVIGGQSGGGVIPEDRYEFLRDLREAMEEDGIGWAYWSYNETFTVLDPSVRVPFSKSPSYGWIDEEMLHTFGMLCGEGDINCDNTVDYEDLMILADQWLQAPDAPPYADIAPAPDGDGIADFLDFSAVGKHWKENVTP